MLKVWVPFWKFRTEKVEKWLAQMAARGLHLVEIKGWGYFLFRTGQPQATIYGVGFNPTEHDLPQALIRDGWGQILRRRNWYIASNVMPREDIKIYPDREQYRFTILRHLDRISLLIQVSLVLTLFPLWVLAALSQSKLITIKLPPWILPFIFCLALPYLITVIMSWVISPGREKLALEAPDDSIIKRKLAWTSAPDKLEQWLEEMAARGYRLHKVEGSKFYYTKGKGRKVKYCVDYQIWADNRYYETHAEAGWERFFTGHNSFGSWTIWAQEYQDSPPQPLYSDKAHLLRHALRVAISTTLVASIYIPWSFTLIRMEMDTVVKHGINLLSLGLLGLFGTVLLLSWFYPIRSWLYYRRLCKHKMS